MHVLHSVDILAQKEYFFYFTFCQQKTEFADRGTQYKKEIEEVSRSSREDAKRLRAFCSCIKRAGLTAHGAVIEPISKPHCHEAIKAVWKDAACKIK